MVASYQMAGERRHVAGPVTAGYLVDTVSYGAAFGLAAGVLGLAAVLGFLAPETRRRPPVRPRPSRTHPPELRRPAASRSPVPGHLSGHDDIERVRGPAG